MARLSFVFILFSLSISPLFCQAGDLKFKRIGSDQSLSNENINDIEQDSRGFIWIATSDGLDRYDGCEIKVYRNRYDYSTSLSSNWVWDIRPLRNGNLVIGTRKGFGG